jgi:hypothetical protein
VEQLESFKFLGVHITNKLEWFKHTKTVMKRARQNLFPLRRLKRFGMGPQIHKKLYSCTIESMVASRPGMLAARLPTARHYRDKCVLPSTSLGTNFLPSRTSIT